MSAWERLRRSWVRVLTWVMRHPWWTGVIATAVKLLTMIGESLRPIQAFLQAAFSFAFAVAYAYWIRPKRTRTPAVPPAAEAKA